MNATRGKAEPPDRWGRAPSASVSSEGSAPSRESSSGSRRNWRAAAGLLPLATRGGAWGRVACGLAQVRRGRIRAELRPEHLEQLLARHAVAGSERKQLHEMRHAPHCHRSTAELDAPLLPRRSDVASIRAVATAPAPALPVSDKGSSRRPSSASAGPSLPDDLDHLKLTVAAVAARSVVKHLSCARVTESRDSRCVASVPLVSLGWWTAPCRSRLQAARGASTSSYSRYRSANVIPCG